MNIEDNKIYEIDSAGNYYGNIHIKKNGNQYYWLVENYNTEFDKIEHWNFITESLFMELFKHILKIEAEEEILKKAKNGDTGLEADFLNKLDIDTIYKYVTSDIVNNLTIENITKLNLRFFRSLDYNSVIKKLNKRVIEYINPETFAGLCKEYKSVLSK